MAERDDIRLRQQVAPSASPTVRDRSKPVKGINFDGLIDQTSKKISATDKARNKAEKTLLDDINNQAQLEYFKSQAKVAQSEKLQTPQTVDGENSRLNKWTDDTVDKKIPPHLREQARVMMAKSRLSYEKFSILHSSKEIEAHEDGVRKSSVELAHQSAVLNAASALGPGGKTVSEYALNIKQIREKTIEHAESKGFSRETDAETVNFMADQAESKTTLDSLKGLSENATFEDTKLFFETYEDRFTGEDKTSAQKVMDQAKVSNKNTIAQALVQEAFLSAPGDPASARKYIEANSPNGDVTVAAISAFDNKLNFKTKMEKKQADDKLANAKTAVRNNKGLVTPDILNLVGPEHHDDLINYGNKLQSNIVTDVKTYAKLDNLRTSNPDAFEEENLDKYQDSLNPKDLDRLKRGQEEARNRNRNRAESVKYSTSAKVREITKQVINSKKISQTDNPQEWLTLSTIGDEIYDRVLESMPNETDMRKVEREYLRQFRAEIYKAPIQHDTFMQAVFSQGPFDALVGDRGSSLVTQEEAIARQRAGENVLDLENADPNLVKQMKNTFKSRKGREITDEELQLWINRDAEKFLRLDNGGN